MLGCEDCDMETMWVGSGVFYFLHLRAFCLLCFLTTACGQTSSWMMNKK